MQRKAKTRTISDFSDIIQPNDWNEILSQTASSEDRFENTAING